MSPGTALRAFRERIERARQTRDEGSLLERALRKALRPLLSWETLVFFERDLSSFRPLRIEAGMPLEIRVASPEDLLAFRDVLCRAPEDWEAIQARSNSGDVCFIGVAEGRLVHFTWLTTTRSWIPELEATLVLDPGDAYVYDSFTDPSVRGHRVQPAVVSTLTRYEQERGYRRHFFYVRRVNAPGLKVTGRLGGLPLAHWTVRAFTFRGLSGLLVTGAVQTGRPRLEMPADTHARSLGPFGLWVASR